MDILKLLLPRNEYAAEEQKYDWRPVMFEVKNDKQVLFYFGANHSHNPADPQYPILKKYWNKFLKATKNKDRKDKIVLVEGCLRPLEDEEKAIINGSEGSFMTLLAHEADVSVVCPDFNNDELMESLPDLNKDEVLLYWFLSWFNNFQKRIEPKPNFEKSVQMWCENQKQKKIWKDTKISLLRLKELYKKILDKDFNEKENQNNLINPNKIGTPINRVASAQSDLRDINITTEILRYWNEGKSIFAVFGRGHLIIQKPALRKLLS